MASSQVVDTRVEMDAMRGASPRTGTPVLCGIFHFFYTCMRLVGSQSLSSLRAQRLWGSQSCIQRRIICVLAASLYFVH